MIEVILAMVLFLCMFFLMGIGYVVAKKKLTGSCGGLGQMFGACHFCDKADTCTTSKS